MKQSIHIWMRQLRFWAAYNRKKSVAEVFGKISENVQLCMFPDIFYMLLLKTALLGHINLLHRPRRSVLV